MKVFKILDKVIILADVTEVKKFNRDLNDATVYANCTNDMARFCKCSDDSKYDYPFLLEWSGITKNILNNLSKVGTSLHSVINK